MSTTSDVPDWLVLAVGRAAAMFYLHAWDIKARSIHDPTRPEGEDYHQRLALAEFDTEYLTATLFFQPNLKPDDEGMDAVLHEVLHLVLAEMRETVKHLIANVPKGRRKALWQRYEWAEERLIVVLTRGMIAQFDLTGWLEKAQREREEPKAEAEMDNEKSKGES